MRNLFIEAHPSSIFCWLIVESICSPKQLKQAAFLTAHNIMRYF